MGRPTKAELARAKKIMNASTKRLDRIYGRVFVRRSFDVFFSKKGRFPGTVKEFEGFVRRLAIETLTRAARR